MAVDFQYQLSRFGPSRNHPVPTLWAARNFCARFTRGNYENFSVISRLLPKKLVPHFEAVYSYCRWADDLGDKSESGVKALELLRWWRRELEDCYQGKAQHPVFVALMDTIREFQIPIQPFQDLLFAFEQDQLVHSYKTYSQLLNYCRYSANPVGRVVLMLWRSHDSEKGGLADQVCTGLQLANFWQDVARDADMGRVYLPVEDRLRWGYSDEDLGNRRQNRAFENLLRDLVDRAESLLLGGKPLVQLVPPSHRVDLDLFIGGGLAILQKIRQGGFRLWEKRPKISRWDKAAILGKAVIRHLPNLVFNRW